MTNTSRRDILKRGSQAIAGVGVLGSAATAAAASGQLAITVYADKVVDGELQSTPFEDVTVADGTYENPSNRLGVTDENGYLETSLSAGEHSLQLFKQTSTRGYQGTFTDKRDIDVSIEAGETTTIVQHMAPKTVTVSVENDAVSADSLYITGETDYLGNWERARKVAPSNVFNWDYRENLPVGAEYKIVRSIWADRDTIPTTIVDWEVGENRTITHDPPNEREYWEYRVTESPYPVF